VAPQPTHRALPAVRKRCTHQEWVDETAERARLRKENAPAIAARQAKAAEEHVRIVAKSGYSVGRQLFALAAEAAPKDAKRWSVDGKWLGKAATDVFLQLVKSRHINASQSDVSTFFLALRLGIDDEIAARKMSRVEEAAN
jgi:hypothetical protein